MYKKMFVFHNKNDKNIYSKNYYELCNRNIEIQIEYSEAIDKIKEMKNEIENVYKKYSIEKKLADLT